MVDASEIMTFLTERLDADEQIALAATHGAQRSEAGVWTHECDHADLPGDEMPYSHELCCVVEGDIHIYNEGGHTPDQAAHIARWDPARVLAEIAVKRRIIDGCVGAMFVGEIQPGTTWNDDAAGAVVGEHVLRLLAMARHDHPDYDPEWDVPASWTSI